MPMSTWLIAWCVVTILNGAALLGCGRYHYRRGYAEGASMMAERFEHRIDDNMARLRKVCMGLLQHEDPDAVDFASSVLEELDKVERT